MFNYIAYIP